MSPTSARLARVSGLALFTAVLTLGLFPARGDAATPVVTIAPLQGTSVSGSYQDGEVVTVTVKDNSTFTPGSKVNILECADPGGTAANLPKTINTCDGDTIQGDTVLVQPGGGISESHYTIYLLPSAALGERPDGQPVCDGTNQCVLYVGENQNDFTQPKLFSPPFTVTAATSGAGTAAAGAGSSGAAATVPATTSAPSSSSSSSSSTSTSDPQGSLAFTGTGGSAPWLVGVGALLLVLGGAGRRWARVKP
jgi:hypothetical protein